MQLMRDDDLPTEGQRGTVTFECGATIQNVLDPRPFSTAVKSDRVRLVVYDSEGDEVQRPTVAGYLFARNGAPCLFGCPKKRASGRQEYKCFPSDEDDLERRRVGGERMGVDIPWRRVVTCYGRWEADRDV